MAIDLRNEREKKTRTQNRCNYKSNVIREKCKKKPREKKITIKYSTASNVLNDLGVAIAIASVVSEQIRVSTRFDHWQWYIHMVDQNYSAWTKRKTQRTKEERERERKIYSNESRNQLKISRAWMCTQPNRTTTLQIIETPNRKASIFDISIWSSLPSVPKDPIPTAKKERWTRRKRLKNRK